MTERVIVPFPVTVDELVRLIGQANDRGDPAAALELVEELRKRRLKARYAEMARQDPNADGW